MSCQLKLSRSFAGGFYLHKGDSPHGHQDDSVGNTCCAGRYELPADTALCFDGTYKCLFDFLFSHFLSPLRNNSYKISYTRVYARLRYAIYYKYYIYLYYIEIVVIVVSVKGVFAYSQGILRWDNQSETSSSSACPACLFQDFRV